MTKKGLWINLVVLLLLAVFFVRTITSFLEYETPYTTWNTSTRSYNKAKVLNVEKQELELSQNGEYLMGSQLLQVQFINGKEKGKVVETINYLTAEHSVLGRSGQVLIICSDTPKNVESFYTVYNYSRSTTLWLIALAFMGLISLIGGRKGLRSAVSLIFTLFMVICFLLPALYRGENPVFMAVLSCSISAAVALYFLNGISYETLMDITSTTLGVSIAGITFFFLSKALTISGYQSGESEALLLISQGTGLHIRDILYAGVLTASLGAVMDLAVSVRAAITEIYQLKPESSGKALFLSGMNIGRDMIGTMTNTLILAFAGSALLTLLVFISYGVQYEQLLSSDYLAIELAQAIAGSMAVSLMVPITSLICAVGYPRVKKLK